MSGIYIPGMEMPTAGTYLCELGVLDENTAVLTVYTPIDKPQVSYKLVPVPEHGRLIDADAYEALILGLGNRKYRRDNGTICDAIKFLHPHYAPTIIPADPAKEETE